MKVLKICLLAALINNCASEAQHRILEATTNQTQATPAANANAQTDSSASAPVDESDQTTRTAAAPTQAATPTPPSGEQPDLTEEKTEKAETDAAKKEEDHSDETEEDREEREKKELAAMNEKTKKEFDNAFDVSEDFDYSEMDTIYLSGQHALDSQAKSIAFQNLIRKSPVSNYFVF